MAITYYIIITPVNQSTYQLQMYPTTTYAASQLCFRNKELMEHCTPLRPSIELNMVHTYATLEYFSGIIC